MGVKVLRQRIKEQNPSLKIREQPSENELNDSLLIYYLVHAQVFDEIIDDNRKQSEAYALRPMKVEHTPDEIVDFFTEQRNEIVRFLNRYFDHSVLPERSYSLASIDSSQVHDLRDAVWNLIRELKEDRSNEGKRTRDDLRYYLSGLLGFLDNCDDTGGDEVPVDLVHGTQNRMKKLGWEKASAEARGWLTILWEFLKEIRM
jgi:hypothetical protein